LHHEEREFISSELDLVQMAVFLSKKAFHPDKTIEVKLNLERYPNLRGKAERLELNMDDIMLIMLMAENEIAKMEQLLAT
jgi:hypothetical protein